MSSTEEADSALTAARAALGQAPSSNATPRIPATSNATQGTPMASIQATPRIPATSNATQGTPATSINATPRTKATSNATQGTPLTGPGGSKTTPRIPATGNATQRTSTQTKQSGGQSSGTTHGQLTLAQFKVDLGQFNESISTVTQATNTVEADFARIKTQLSTVADAWKSPAGETYQDVQAALTKATDEFVEVFRGVITQMHTTYQNYLSAENADTHNVS